MSVLIDRIQAATQQGEARSAHVAEPQSPAALWAVQAQSSQGNEPQLMQVILKMRQTLTTIVPGSRPET